MSVLSHQSIRSLLTAPNPLLSDYLDLDTQIQSNGFDLTLQQIERFQSPAHVSIENTGRKLPVTEKFEFDDSGVAHLTPGPYLITLNEVVALPTDIMALGKPRSSLLRSGVTINNAVWDAGYQGRSQALLVVYNPYGFSIAQNARVLQLIFMRLDTPTNAPYSGVYQKEHISP